MRHAAMDAAELEADHDERLPRAPVPGKRTLTQSLAPRPQPRPRRTLRQVSAASPPSAPLQARAAHDDVFALHLTSASPTQPAAAPHAIAHAGLTGAPSTLPHLDTIQRAFGPHDVRATPAFVGGPAATASQRLGAHAYATDGAVGFAGAPDLHTAAHEAAHVVQQRSGVQLRDGLGRPGDEHERHADAVADRVVAGRSAVDLLDGHGGGGGGGGVQLSAAPDAPEATEAEPETDADADADAALAELEADATAVSAALAAAHSQLSRTASQLPPGAQAEIAALLDEVMGYDDAMWAALDDAGGGDGAPSADALAAIDRAITRVELATDLLAGYQALWNAFVAVNIVALLALLAGMSLATIQKLRAQLDALEAELRALDVKVKAAKQDLLEVAAQTGLDVAVDLALPALLTALGVTNPFVGAAIAIAGFLLTWNADNLLGVDADGAFGAVNDLNGRLEGAGAGAEGGLKFLHGVVPLSATEAKLLTGAEGVGKGCTALGLALDAWEAKLGTEKLIELRAEVEAANKKVQALVPLWKQVAPHLGTIERVAKGLKAALPVGVAKIGQERANIAAVRAELASVR